jgi:hypothetical protein
MNLDMKKIFKTENAIFPYWVKLFHNDPNLKQQLSKIRILREKRSELNFGIPYINLGKDFLKCFKTYIKIRQDEISQKNLQIKEVYQAHKKCIDVFTKIAHRTFWTRWLYLERAFELASLNGDLLSGAIFLRTLIEDVWALLELADFEKHLKEDGDNITVSDLNRIRSHGDLLFERFLPPVSDIETLPNCNPPKRFGKYKDLEKSFQSLNDYVHPNYGSHILAIFPERAKALTVLMDAYITIYDYFLQIPWIYDLIYPSVKLPPIKFRSWREERNFLMKKVYISIQQYLANRYPSSEVEDPAPNLKEWLERSEVSNIEQRLNSDYLDSLKPLCEFITDSAYLKSRAECCNKILSSRNLGLPVTLYELAYLAKARHISEELEKNFSSGRNLSLGNILLWFRFFTKASSLALAITLYKINLMIRSTICQLNDQNPIGAIIASRSVIEHHLIVLYIGNRLQSAWEELIKDAGRGSLPVEALRKMEKEIAKFLSGTKGTKEETMKWKEEWSKIGLDKALGLRTATDEFAKESGGLGILHFLYDFGSQVIHGFRARGVELCPPIESTYTYLMRNLLGVLIALDIITSPIELLRLERNFIIAADRIENLAKSLSKPNANQKKILETIASAENGLVQGTHYTGSGTIDDPIIFAEGLNYYDSFYKFCNQFGLNTKERRWQIGPQGEFLDVVPNDKGELFYFLARIDERDFLLDFFL